MAAKGLSLHEKALVAAFRLSGGDPSKTFTGEDILVQAWNDDKAAWGLRGYEKRFPDSNKLYSKIDGSSGLVERGYLRGVGPRTYEMTPLGLTNAASFETVPSDQQEKMERKLQDEVMAILSHATFRGWLNDRKTPSRFRDIGAFWGIAPGTPPRVIRERVGRVERTLQAARSHLAQRDINAIVEERGSKNRYESSDIGRCLEFQAEMKSRFKRDLRLLDPDGNYEA